MQCQCEDPGCPHCSGTCRSVGIYALERVDMDHRTLMCPECTQDAIDSGLFTNGEARTVEEYWSAHRYAQQALQKCHRDLVYMKAQCHKGGKWPHRLRQLKKEYRLLMESVELLLTFGRPA